MVLTALFSSGGLAGEELASIALNDALLLAVQAEDADRAAAAGETLNRLREALTGRDPAVYVPRRAAQRRGRGRGGPSCGGLNREGAAARPRGGTGGPRGGGGRAAAVAGPLTAASGRLG